MRVGEHNAIGDVGFGERGGKNFSGEVAGFVGVAFAAAGAAAEAEAHVVFGEDVGEAFDFAGVGDGEKNLIAGTGEFLNFFEHRRNRAVEAGSGLGQKCDGGSFVLFVLRVMPRCSTSAPVA